MLALQQTAAANDLIVAFCQNAGYVNGVCDDVQTAVGKDLCQHCCCTAGIQRKIFVVGYKLCRVLCDALLRAGMERAARAVWQNLFSRLRQVDLPACTEQNAVAFQNGELPADSGRGGIQLVNKCLHAHGFAALKDLLNTLLALG